MEENDLAERLRLRTPVQDSPDLCLGAEMGSGESFFDYVGSLLGSLIPRFGLDRSQETIARAYHLICRESLAIPKGRRPPNFSRINQDGTPFQFSLTLGAFRPPLQFLSEAGIPGSSNEDRLLLSKERIGSLCTLFGAKEPRSDDFNLLDEMVPAGDPDLRADPAGAVWIGTRFAPEDEPKLKIYLNVKWGPAPKRWARLNPFASYFGAAARWQELEKLVKAEMEPLGAALIYDSGHPPSGRIYLSAYGRPLAYYRYLARLTTNMAFQSLFERYTETLLRADCRYPTHSIVCSFGFDPQGNLDFKFEMCAHCAFASDVEARGRCLDWLKLQEVEPTGYLQMLEILSDGVLSETEPLLHCYVGLGLKRDQPYSTFYFKPVAGQSFS